VFKRKALEIQEHFLQHFSDLVVDINLSAPRRGAFEIMVTNSRGVGMIIFMFIFQCVDFSVRFRIVLFSLLLF
jgi:hypothetical protein